ncbi:PDZ domain-containing protein [Limosilactobacillus gastricus]|uniref:endopeptidase La n=1 Tax=Limosilactobacillus gastricus DSM 16045 TaxID=1423749 RepID=A0A0R1VFB1_9LACO|nr:SepM family pheromone-processing serine protease [Limosilactobacillus gastricus]KRM02827.1 hypothetical protein FC60_GL001522 [Limosilactobacillus gastricus DSM 16045]QGF40752.1 PDZ domain-containing protein [Limosilactobacillus gastricus]
MKNQERRLIRRLILIIFGILVAMWFFLWPLNSYIETPGTADALKSYVTIKKHPDKWKGSYMLTSVYLQRARPVTYLWAKFMNPLATIESAEDVTGGQSDKTYDKVQNFYMQSAINQAISVAYKAAGQQYTKKYLGIYVLEVQKNSKFKKKIKVGDTITKVDGHHFNTAAGYQKYIAKQGVGHRLSVTYTHNGKTKTVTEPLVKLSTGKAGIGIILTDNVKVTTDIPVKVDPGEIGGPSGGLMFALQIYQQISGKDLRHGQQIAGTGTIAADGSVGEIGGIDKKVVAAHKAGATIFFAPYVKPTKELLKYEEQHMTNYQLAKKTAKKYAPNMKVVPVTSFQDAVDYLNEHAK